MFSFFFCNMLGVNVAKSSLHLRFLKTLEFRTDVSVTGMPGAARATGAHRFTPTTLLWGSKTRDTKQQPAQTLLLILYPSAMGPRQYDLWASNITGLCASALLRGRFLSPSSEPGSKCTTGREWVPGPAPAWIPGAQVQVLSPHVKVVTFLFPL